MKINNLLFGIGVGIAAGYFIAKQMQNENITPELALRKVKSALKESDASKIIGSWIQTKTEKIDRFGLPYEVYNGGLSLQNKDEEKQYNFRIDAKTGTILELGTE